MHSIHNCASGIIIMTSGISFLNMLCVRTLTQRMLLTFEWNRDSTQLQHLSSQQFEVQQLHGIIHDHYIRHRAARHAGRNWSDVWLSGVLLVCLVLKDPHPYSQIQLLSVAALFLGILIFYNDWYQRCSKLICKNSALKTLTVKTMEKPPAKKLTPCN